MSSMSNDELSKQVAIANLGNASALTLTKIEHVAAMIMASFAATRPIAGEPEELAQTAVKWADALLRALYEHPPNIWEQE